MLIRSFFLLKENDNKLIEAFSTHPKVEQSVFDYFNGTHSRMLLFNFHPVRHIHTVHYLQRPFTENYLKEKLIYRWIVDYFD